MEDNFIIYECIVGHIPCFHGVVYGFGWILKSSFFFCFVVSFILFSSGKGWKPRLIIWYQPKGAKCGSQHPKAFHISLTSIAYDLHPFNKKDARYGFKGVEWLDSAHFTFPFLFFSLMKGWKPSGDHIDNIMVLTLETKLALDYNDECTMLVTQTSLLTSTVTVMYFTFQP